MSPSPLIHDAILAARKQAILFRQIVPPNYDPAHVSFFGGLPIAPSSFQWPRGRSGPYSFIMQVDCSTMPAAGRLGMFPDDGVVYVFLDLVWGYESGYENTFSVMWEPGPAQGWAEIAPPADLPHAYEDKRYWKWPQSDTDWPHLLPKWPFDPVLIQTELSDDEEALEESDTSPGTINPQQGVLVRHRSFRWQGGKPTKDRPFAGFPHDWNAVRITTGLIANRMEHEVRYAQSRYNFRNLSDEEYAAKVAEAQAALRYWSDRATAAAPFDEVPPPERDQFWSWVDENNWLTDLPMTHAGELSVEASLNAGPEAAARIPLEVIDYIRSRHELAFNSRDRMLAAPTDVQGDIDERVREFLLLLELFSNEGLAHYFGEGVYQFWIRPDDLAARRFDRVELSTTAY